MNVNNTMARVGLGRGYILHSMAVRPTPITTQHLRRLRTVIPILKTQAVRKRWSKRRLVGQDLDCYIVRSILNSKQEYSNRTMLNSWSCITQLFTYTASSINRKHEKEGFFTNKAQRA